MLRDGVLPILEERKWRVVESVKGEVCSAVITSTPVCTGTGFMKWAPMTLDAVERSLGLSLGRVAAAILVILMLEVFVARMACGALIFAKSAKMDCLSEGISGTASMIMSAEERPSMLDEGESRERASSASDCVRRDFETDLARSESANFRDLVSEEEEES